MDGLDSRVLVSDEDSTYVMAQGLNEFTGGDERSAVEAAAWPDDADHSRYGPRNTTASTGGIYHPDDTNGQVKFRDSIMDKSDLWIKYLRDGAAGWKQKVRVASFGVSVARDGVAEVSIDLEGTGARSSVSGESPTVPALTDAKDGLDARLLKSGTSTAFSNETCTEVSATVFQITDADKRVWDRTASITVEVSTDGGSTWTENTDNTIDRLFGTITFDSSQTGNDVRVSGNYLPMTNVAEAKEFEWSLTRNITDKSAFNDDDNEKSYGSLAFEGSGTLNYDSTADFESDINDKTFRVMEFQQGESVDARAWVVVASDEETTERNSPVEESVSFSGAADADRRVVSFGP